MKIFLEYSKEKEKNKKLELALDKSCQMLTNCCPVKINLIENLNCEKCENFENCVVEKEKECWKNFLLKEVLKDD